MSHSRLIEVDPPIKRISAHAWCEKSIRHGAFLHPAYLVVNPEVMEEIGQVAGRSVGNSIDICVYFGRL